MLPRVDPSAELLGLARAQGGVVSAEQADLLGLGRHSKQRLLRTGQWQRVEGPVYAVHVLPLDFTARAWTGVLLGGPGPRLGGESAGFLHGLTTEEPRSVDVLVPLRSRLQDRPLWTFTRETPGARDARSPGDPPRLALEDTVLDLCEGADARAVVDWVTRAVQTRRTSAVRLRRALDERSRHSRRRLLTELLDDVGEGADSPLELRYLRDVERPHGLPRGVRQHRSRHRYRRDVVYPEYGVVVELDGRLGHEGVGRFRDMERDNLSALDGETTFRYGHADVSGEACGVARQVAGVLTVRGWTGVLRPCPRCLR
ncbi:hypothetical protein ACFFOM_04500 [Microlunatus capsulatus]|uniref:Transcriptional regulator, AbiEi antitoxin, Type IV TA system n=1 Tax=Microlunatus capsulatus TaxID=99117 RepID=A0ABS4Z4J5_9ACTN|nr:hypothetical protein [Microlunatus capsulatus]MBP2415973.1 hypothetical protein [Microlunatus capsulatus]